MQFHGRPRHTISFIAGVVYIESVDGVCLWWSVCAPLRAGRKTPPTQRGKSGVSAVQARAGIGLIRRTVARYGLARLVAARHAIWRLRRTGSQPCANTNNPTDTDSYVPTKPKIKINIFKICTLSLRWTSPLLTFLNFFQIFPLLTCYNVWWQSIYFFCTVYLNSC